MLDWDWSPILIENSSPTLVRTSAISRSTSLNLLNRVTKGYLTIIPYTSMPFQLSLIYDVTAIIYLLNVL